MKAPPNANPLRAYGQLMSTGAAPAVKQPKLALAPRLSSKNEVASQRGPPRTKRAGLMRGCEVWARRRRRGRVVAPPARRRRDPRVDGVGRGADHVEWLAMRAMALGLVKGVIDEVAQVVEVSWVQPRVLDAGQISHLIEQIDTLSSKSLKAHGLIAEQAAELL